MDRDKKRKLPARAAARSDQSAKKRNAATPSTERSMTPEADASPAPPPPPAQPQTTPLPTSITSGKPLPTVETPQPEDLSSKEYQSIQESGVLSESLNRSRKVWQEGIFERYWTKPKPKKKAAAVAAASSTTSTPTPAAAVPEDTHNNPPKDSMVRVGHVTIKLEPHSFEATMYTVKNVQRAEAQPQPRFKPTVQYGPPGGELAPSPAADAAAATPQIATAAVATTPSQPATPTPVGPAGNTVTIKGSPSSASASASWGVAAAAPPLAAQPPPPSQPSAAPSPTTSSPSHPQAAKPGEKQSDPIIATLAEKASEDQWLRDVMKRVASGSAAPAELAQFQKIIDQIATDYKRKSTPGPPAHTLFVNGRSVATYAEEVNNILAIVLAANPSERGSTVRVPSTCTPLVEALLRTALDQNRVADVVRRVANKRPENPDSLDLRDELERLCATIPDRPSVVASRPATPAQRKETPRRADCAAVVFEIFGGDGNRYLFPKYSVLTYVPAPGGGGGGGGGSHVLASFLIVRRGHGEPAENYWEPVTIRIQGKNLDLLRSVVAPEDEVRRYMDQIKRTMTRAEFVLLAMRLPREEERREKDKEKEKDDAAEASPREQQQQQQPRVPVMWAVKAKQQTPSSSPAKRQGDDAAQAKYQKFVSSIAE